MTVEELFQGIEENLGLKCPFDFVITNLLGNNKKMGPILMLRNEDSFFKKSRSTSMHASNQSRILKPGDCTTEMK